MFVRDPTVEVDSIRPERLDQSLQVVPEVKFRVILSPIEGTRFRAEGLEQFLAVLIVPGLPPHYNGVEFDIEFCVLDHPVKRLLALNGSPDLLQ